ncbi:hypothetical protein RZS08_01270, partial [Arthrospira platensis SPKY1]|nr:hypothetical protein [Arthrospira platensis SPKY1]
QGFVQVDDGAAEVAEAGVVDPDIAVVVGYPVAVFLGLLVDEFVRQLVLVDRFRKLSQVEMCFTHEKIAVDQAGVVPPAQVSPFSIGLFKGSQGFLGLALLPEKFACGLKGPGRL